jgi:hypothetical protein
MPTSTIRKKAVLVRFPEPMMDHLDRLAAELYLSREFVIRLAVAGADEQAVFRGPATLAELPARGSTAHDS